MKSKDYHSYIKNNMWFSIIIFAVGMCFCGGKLNLIFGLCQLIGYLGLANMGYFMYQHYDKIDYTED